MRSDKLGIFAGLIAGFLFMGIPAAAASPERLSGSVVGFVSDTTGIPQMGATVLLFNRYERLMEKVLTNEKGAFGFSSLTPDVYSIKVTLASFVPAVKHDITVQPGMRSFLTINLASVLSSIELMYIAPGGGAIMNDDWKWVLRSSQATRPILRMLPRVDISDPEQRTRVASSVFSQTRGLVRVSAGDSSRSSDSQPDLGTAFALATSVFGSNQIQFSGNLGYASRLGTPSAGFSTRFSRADADAGRVPEVQLTMRQAFLPSRVGAAIVGGQDATPAMRTMSLTMIDHADFGEGARFVYGFSIDSVSFLDRLNYVSPFAKLSYAMGDRGTLELGYSNGFAPPELYRPEGSEDADLQDTLASLAAFPRVSLRGDRAHVQRAENMEIGYRKVAGSRTYALGVYHEKVNNAALTISGADGLFAGSDVLPDLFSSSGIFNIGNYSSLGYTASVTQAAGEHLNLTVGYGNGEALRTEQRTVASNNPEDLRDMIHGSRQNWAMAKLNANAPVTGTRMTVSYLWTDYRSLTPGHLYLTQSISPQAGLNIHLRQPLPAIGGLPGRLEMNADLRNMLAQGYLPFNGADGRQFLLVHSPRSVRGGLSFIF